MGLAAEACKASKSKLMQMSTMLSQKQINLSEVQNLLNIIAQKEQATEEYFRIVREAKVIETSNMMKNLSTIGKIIKDIQECRKGMEVLQTKLLSLEETINFSLKITKYAQGYEECLKEIARRKNHSNKVKDFIQKTNDTLKNQREIEISKRLSFRRSYGDSIIPKLMPFLMKSEEEESSLPISTFNITSFDNDLPDVEIENVEDEFSFVVLEDPTERVKSLEKENAFLNERLSLLIKNSTNNTESLNLNNRSTKRLQEAEKEISNFKDLLEREKKSRSTSEIENRDLRKKLQELDQSQTEKMKKLEVDIKNYEVLLQSLLGQ